MYANRGFPPASYYTPVQYVIVTGVLKWQEPDGVTSIKSDINMFYF